MEDNQSSNQKQEDTSAQAKNVLPEVAQVKIIKGKGRSQTAEKDG
jgi:hypothetical protein